MRAPDSSVHTAAATNRDTTDVANPAVTYSLKPNNSDDAASFSTNSSTGAVTLTGDPNYESKASYSFTVLATDQDGNQAEQTVTLSVTNEDELAPPSLRGPPLPSRKMRAPDSSSTPLPQPIGTPLTSRTQPSLTPQAQQQRRRHFLLH